MADINLRKSKGLTFPYDWSNVNIPDKVFIYRVLERGILEDIVRVSIRYGSTFVLEQAEVYKTEIRKLNEIDQHVEMVLLNYNLRVMMAVLKNHGIHN